jgi:hypothetical protein
LEPGKTPVDQLDARFAFVVPLVSQAIGLAAKFQLVLLPVASIELLGVIEAVVAGLSETLTKLTLLVPVLFRLHVVPALLDCTVIKFPLAPVSVSNPETPNVCPAVNVRVEPAVVSLSPAKFVAPVTTWGPTPVNTTVLEPALNPPVPALFVQFPPTFSVLPAASVPEVRVRLPPTVSLVPSVTVPVPAVTVRLLNV